jgi:hypothetical protein
MVRRGKGRWFRSRFNFYAYLWHNAAAEVRITQMNVKQAVNVAKDYISDLFVGEQIRNLGLEEVEFDDHRGIWLITIGFARPWENAGFLSKAGLAEPRSYKVVRVTDEDGRVISVKDRRAVVPA